MTTFAALPPLHALDFETTGLDPSFGRVLEVGLAGPRPFHALVADARPSSPAAQSVHGITREELRRAGRPGAQVFAGLMAAQDELPAFDPTSIDRAPRQASIDKLMALPSFRAAYEFEGMKPDDFAHYGAFKATETEFASATRQTVDFVRMTLES